MSQRFGKLTGKTAGQAVRPVVFLDRDGTLNAEAGYITKVEELTLLPAAAPAVKMLNQSNLAAIVVTNQSGPARGLYSESHVQALNRRLCDLLAQSGGRLDALYYCPHHTEGTVAEYAVNCNCRKPQIGLLQRAFEEHPDLNRSQAYMIGDLSTDIVLARNAGIKAILVKTGHGIDVLEGRKQWVVEPDYVAEDVLDAVKWVLQDLG